MFRQRITTRLFILLLALSIVAVGLYLFFAIQTQVITVTQPSLDTYDELYAQRSPSLICPCSQISVRYGTFLTINYTLHQVCASSLVSSEWLAFVLSFDQALSIERTDSSFAIDFRRTAPSYFQLVATLCSIARETIGTALSTLMTSRFVNDRVLSRSLFDEQIQRLNQTFTSSLRENFLAVKDWIDITVQVNQFLTGLNLNGLIRVSDDHTSVSIEDPIWGLIGIVEETWYASAGPCSCRKNAYDCQIVSILYQTLANGSLSQRNFVGMNAGCVPWYGVLRSNIGWWYKNASVEQIRQTFTVGAQSELPPSIQALDPHVDSRFRQENELYPDFHTLVEEILIESWIGNRSRFDLFFKQCAPTFCSYTIDDRYSRITALLLLASICGGLNRALRLLVPVLVLIVFNTIDTYRNRLPDQGKKHASACQFFRSSDTPNFLGVILSVRAHNLARKIGRLLTNLNLYESRSTDRIIIRGERIYTRIYGCLLTVSIVLLLFYIGVEQRSETKTIPAPENASEYERLQPFYENTLRCSCTRVSMQYNAFIPSLIVQAFHPVCSMPIYSTDSLVYLMMHLRALSSLPSDDFRHWSGTFFQAIQALCSLALVSVEHGIATFLSSAFITDRVISQEHFDRQMNTTIVHFQRQMTAEFSQVLESMRLTSQGNHLMSLYLSDWQLILRDNQSGMASLSIEPVTYGNSTCSCATSHRCSITATLYDIDRTPLFPIDGLRFGCTTLETLLQSSLECFHLPVCFDGMLNAMLISNFDTDTPYDYPLPFSVIDSNMSTLSIYDTMETMITRMMIDAWQWNASYPLFYNSCAPRECTFTRQYRFAVRNMITTFLSVFSGLSSILRYAVPRCIVLFKRIWNRNRVQNNNA